MLKVSVVSSHNLKKKTGWDDLQLCDEAYLVLRDTNRDLEKRCVHFIDLNSKKFVHKIETISPLVQSIIFSCCTPSGLKIVGILGSGAIFYYDFLEKKYHSIQTSLPAVFGSGAASSVKEEIAAFGASNDVSCVVIVSKSLQQYCFIDTSKFGKHQVVSEHVNWAKCAFDKYPGKPHINICFTEDGENYPNSFSVYVCQLHQDQIVLQKSTVKFDASNAESQIRSWQIPIRDRGQEKSASSDSGVEVTCAVSLDHKCVAIVAQGSGTSSDAPTNLYLCNTRSEKLGIIRKQIFPNVACASRNSLVVAMEFSSDSNLLIVLTRLGEVSIFTLFGEQLLLHCDQLSEIRSSSLPVIPPASSAQLAAKQNFRVRSHWLIERRFVVTDGFQAMILEIETANPELSTAYEVAQGFLDHSEMMISNAADLAESVSKELTPMKLKMLKRQSSETALNQAENGRLLYRTQSLGNSNGSIPDLVKAYEAYLGNIGSNDSILSVKSAKRRGASLESVAENPVAQCLQFLDQALIGFAQTLGYYWKFSFQNTPFDVANFISCIESFFATFRKHCENFEHDDKFESIYALQSHVTCQFVANLSFALFHSAPEVSDESFDLFWKAANIATGHLQKSVIAEPDKLFTALLTNCLLSKVDLLNCGETAEVTQSISLQSERCLDLKNLYTTLCKYFAANSQMMNSTQHFDTRLYLTYLQRSLLQSGLNPKFLHTASTPDVLARHILDNNLGYKTQCSKIAKEYQKRYQYTLSQRSMEMSPFKLENSSLTSLYLFLSNYDLEGVLQLIDTCISCFLAYENSLWPLNNNPELLASDKVQLFPFSFVDLITKDEGQLLFVPVVFAVSSEAPSSSRSSEQKAESEEGRRQLLENRSKALRSVARIMGKYFLADQKLFIHPVHCAQEVASLLQQDDPSQTLSVENRPREVFLSRVKLTQQLNKLELTSVWTPQLAFSLLLVCGLFEEAAAFASKLGNDRITTAIHSAVHKLTEKRPQKHPLDLGTKLETLRQDLFNKIESKNREFLFKLDAIGVGLENYMSDLFQLGIICGIDLVPITLRECLERITSLESGFSLAINEGVQLPLRPLFVTQNVDQDCDETKLRNQLHNQMYLYRLCLHASNCDVVLVKHYLLALQKALKKTEVQLPQALVSKVRLSVDVNLLDDPTYNDVTKSFRAFLFLLWLSHVRDQFSLALRAYNDLYSHVFSGSTSEPRTSRDSSNEGNLSSRSFADLSQKWSDCIRWARLLIPFCKYMGEEVQLVDCLISLFMQVPLSEDNVSLLASVFCQPKRVEPKPNFDEDESFVFDSSHFALSHADYDLSSNEMVPFILEKKYKKLMIKMRNAPNFESGEVFKHFVKQQRLRRSFIVQKGYENCELFVDSSENLPEMGRLEFELSQEYISFLEAAIDIMFTSHTSGNASVPEGRRKQDQTTLNSTPVLLPYAKQVEKQLYTAGIKEEKGTNQPEGDNALMTEKDKYVDDLMVPSMRHFLQQCISRKALGRQWRRHKKKQVSINQDPTSVKAKKTPEKVGLAALEATSSSINSVLTEEKSFIETLSNNCTVMEDHFSLISAKEQISHAVLLSGDVFYNQLMDSQKFCIAWLSDWCGRSYPALSKLTEQSKQVGGSLKLKVTPNLLLNTCWNYTNSTNGWPFSQTANQQVYVTLPASAQYHVEDLKVEQSGQGPVSAREVPVRNEVDESLISARIGDAIEVQPANVSGFDEMDDSTLPSITASSRISPPHLSPPRSRGAEGHSSRQSSARDALGAPLTDTERTILQTIKEPHLREEAHRKMLEAREAEMLLHSSERESSASPRRKIVLSPETLRRLVRSETSQAIQKLMGYGDGHNASPRQYLHTQAQTSPKGKDSYRHRKSDENGYSHNVQFNLSNHQYGDTSDSFYPEYLEDTGYRSRGRSERDQNRKERHSRSRDKKRRRKEKRSKQFDPQTGYGLMATQGHVIYPQRRVPQTVEIPLLQANAYNNISLLRHQGELETDPYYLTGQDYPGGFLQASEISMNEYHHASHPGRGTLQVHQNPDDHLTADHLQNILPSSEELSVFLESRRRRLEESKTSGRLQRLAWVTGEENKENGFSRQEQNYQFPPVNEDTKPKLLHLNVKASLSDEEVDDTARAVPSPRVLKPHVATEEPIPAVALRPILKDQQVGTDHEELKIKKSVTVVTPEEQQVDLQSNLSFEVEDEDLLHNASTSPMPSPKKSEIEVQTVSVEEEEKRGSLTVSQIKQRTGAASNRAATTPEIFMNLHFPHVQNNNFISVADIRESTMADLPEVTSLYHPDGLHSTSYADLHWQIVKELREGPTVQKSQSPETKGNETSKPRSPRKVVFATQDSSTSPLTSPKKGRSPRMANDDDLSLEDMGGQPDQLTLQTLTAMDMNSGVQSVDSPPPSNATVAKSVTPRTRGRTVNDQLATMAQQIEVMEDTSRRLMHELEGTHYLMNTVDAMTNLIDPPAAEQAETEAGRYLPPSDVAQNQETRHSQPVAGQMTSSDLLEAQADESQKDEMQDKPLMSGKDISNTKPTISELDLREIFQNSLLSADVETAREEAKKQEVRKWMKEKRKERMSNYIEHRRDLAQKEFQPWRQKNMVASSALKENIKRREVSKTLRDNEFTEKRLESAKQLLGEMVHDQPPPSSRHPHPSTLSARTVSGASTNRSRTHAKLPLPVARATSKSRSRSRSHSQDPPPGYTSWYEYYRIQASGKLAARRRVAEEIKQEREEEEAELLSRLDELSQLSERSHPDYPSNALGRDQPADMQSKPPSRPPPKLFTSLVKVQNPEATRSRTNSPHKSVTYQEKLKQLQSSSGPLPKPSSSPIRAPVQTKAPGAIVASKKNENKPRVAKTYAERLKELQREKTERTPSRSPAGRASKTMMRGQTARTASPGNVVYSHTQQKWTTRQASPGTSSQKRSTEGRMTPDNRSRTFSMGGRGRGYQRLASQRDRPYASPYREATDTELISGEAAKKSIQGGDADSGGVARDDVSEISDISAWSVPTKVKQLLQIDGGTENQGPAVTSKGGPRSFATSDSPRLTNIDFSEFDEMESQLSSKLDWDAVQQIIEDNEV